MEELVNKLAELQAEVEGHEKRADEASFKIDAEIDALEDEIHNALVERDSLRRPHNEAAGEIQTTINDLKATIIDEWDGEKKTLKFDAVTLKFRTTQSLEIHDPGTLLDRLMSSGLPTSTVAEKYISGFRKTEVKEYIGVLPVADDVAELVSRTTVKLE